MRTSQSFMAAFGPLILVVLVRSRIVIAAQAVESLQITEISRISDTRKRLTVDSVVEPSLSALAILTIPATSEQFNIDAERSDTSNKVFEIDFPDITTTGGGTEIILLFQTLDMNYYPVGTAEAYILLKDMDARLVTVIGDSQFGESVLLRVSTGDLDFVQIREEICQKEKSPCYFSVTSNIPEVLKWCTDVENQAGGGSGTVSLCNEEVTPYEEIPQELETKLLLLDHRTLTLFYSSNHSSVEVLILDPESGNLLSNATVINCVDSSSEKRICSLPVDISQDKDELNCTIVFLGDDGYVNSSGTYHFDISPIQLEYMNDGAVYMSWASESIGNFTISVFKSLDPDEIKFQMSVVCGQSEYESIPCYVFFIRLENGDVITMLKEGQDSAIATTVSLPGYQRYYRQGTVKSQITWGLSN